MDPHPGRPFVYVDDMRACLRAVLAHFGVDVTKVDERGCTPLFTAAGEGKTALVAGLLAAGSDPNETQQDTDLNPLTIAISCGHVHIVRMLISCGADVNRELGLQEETPLHHAGGSNRDQGEECVRLLLKAGADVHRKDFLGRPPLHRMASHDFVTATRLLLEAGADPNDADEGGNAALHAAVERRHAAFGGEETLQCLIKAGGDVNRVDERGRSPLDNALYYGRRSCLRVLLRAGATVDMAKLLEIRTIAFTDAKKWAYGRKVHDEVKLRYFKEQVSHISSTVRYVDKLAAAGGYENLVRTYRQVLTAPRHGCVTRYLRQRFGRDAPHDVAVHVLEFWKPPGGP